MDVRNKMVVDSHKPGQLLITCPFWANDIVQRMPSRKFSKKARAWEVPIIRQNMPAVGELVRLGGVTVTPAAREALDDYDQTSGRPPAVHAGLPTWYKFKTKPRRHQKRALDKGYGLPAFALFMEMQTGKTKTVIDLIACHRMEGHIRGALIFTKLTLRKNIVKQFEQHCPIPFQAHLPETDKAKNFERWLMAGHDFPVLIVGWESLSQGRMIDLCRRFMLSVKSAIAGDESTYIAGHNSTRAELAVELARMAEYRYALSGSPSLEGPLQLFMQFEFLDPNIIGIGDYYAFRNRYAVMGGYHRETKGGKKVPTQIVGYQNLDELSALIAPYVFEVSKKDAYDLPPKRYEVRTVELTKEQRAIYRQIRGERAIPLKDGGAKVIEIALELHLRLHQVVGGYSVSPREIVKTDRFGNPKPKIIYDPVEIVAPKKNPKMLEVMSIVEEVRGRKQGIIWAAYMPEILAIAKLLRGMGVRVGELHGGVPEADRQPMVDEFAAGGIDFVVGNASTGGMGYTMMASEVNVFYNNTHKAIDRVQAEDRAWGDGQTKSGIWIDIEAERTVDAIYRKALEQKLDLAEYLKHNLKQAMALLDGEE